MSRVTLDRDRLHDAINMCTALKLYAWSTSLNDPQKLSSIGIRGIGEVKLPLDEMQIVDLSNRLGKQPLESGTIVVEASDLYDGDPNKRTCTEVFKDLAQFAITEMFNVDTLHFSFNVHAVLDKLVICDSNGLYKGFFNATKQPGVFGNLILQIPVKGAVGGACIEVQYNRETITMEHDVLSETNYHLTAVAGKRIDAEFPQEFTIKPANRWYCVLLIAKLVWQDVIGSSLSIEADRFPQFIEAAYQSNEALSGWRPLVYEGNADQLANSRARYINTNAINPTGHFFIRSQVEEDLPLLSASQTKALCIPVRNNYCIDTFNLSSLTGDDALINRILTSIKYLTVNLVLIKKQSFPTTDWRENALLKTEEFVQVYKPCSKESAELLPLKLTTGENFIGNLRAGITCLKFQRKNCSSCRGSEPCGNFYAAFLIQPMCLNKATVRATNFVALNIIINRAADDGHFDEVFALINGLDSKNIRRRVIDINNQRGWTHWKDTLFCKMLMGSHITRVFRGLSQLALDCHHLKCNDGVEAISACMVELLISSVLGGGSRAALPHVIDFMKAFEMLVPSPSGFVRSVKETLQKLTQAHLATMIRQSKSAENAKYLQIIGDLLLERSFKELTPDLTFGVARVFLTLDDFDLVTSLWKKVCDDAKAEDGNLLHSMIATPKEDHGRIALVTHLASFSEYTKEALDVVVDKLQTTSEITADTLAELFLFFVSVESNELLANEARMDKFISFIIHLELEIVCQLPKKLCRGYGDDPISGLHILKKVIETLLTQHFRKIVRLENVDIVVDFIESIFRLYDENLTSLLVKQVLSWTFVKADVYFRSIALNRHVISLLRTPEKLEDESSRRLITLWIQHVEHFNKILGLSGSTLSKALFVCFPCTAAVNDAFKRLLSNTNPHSLFDFLREVGSKKVENSTKAEGRKYRDILAPAFDKLLKDGEFLRRTPFERLLPIMKVAVWIDDKAIVQALSPFIARSKQQTVAKLIVFHEVPDSIETDEIFIPEGGSEAPECVSTASFEKRTEEKHENSTTSTSVNQVPLKAAKNDVTRANKDPPPSKKLKQCLQALSTSQNFGQLYSEEHHTVVLGGYMESVSEIVHFKMVKEGDNLQSVLFKKSKPASTAEAPAKAITEQIVQPSVANETVPKEAITESDKKITSNEDRLQQRQVIEIDISESPPKKRQISATGSETWCIDDAVVTQNKAFEDFLRSNARSQRFPRKPFEELAEAKVFRENIYNISPWPVHVEINKSKGAYFCDVTKAKKKQRSIPQTAPPPMPVVNRPPGVPLFMASPIILDNPSNHTLPYRAHPSNVIAHSDATSATEPACKRLKTDSQHLYKNK